jgi:AAA domain-containing protein
VDAKLQAELEKMAQAESMSSLQEPRFFRGLLYADPGGGKTDLSIKMAHVLTPPDQWIQLISSDSAWVTVLKYPDIAARTKKVDFDGFSQVKSIAQAKIEGIPGYENLGTVLWDTVSRSVDRMLRRLVDAKKYPNQQIDPMLEAYPHYRLAERSLSETVELLNKAKMNVIYTAHVREPTEKDKEKGKQYIRPSMPEASFKAVAEEVAFIGWLYKEARGNRRQIQLEGTKTVTAKSQISTIPEGTYNNDDIPAMLENWKNG